MARQAVIPGGSIDVVTPRELHDLLRRELRDTPGRNITAAASERQDANGLALVEVYKVPDGMEFELGWVTIELDGSSFLVPVFRSGSAAQLEVNGTARDFYYGEDPDSAVVGFGLITPFRKEYSSGGTVRFRNGSVLAVRYAGGSGGIVTISIGGRLYDVPPTERHA